MPLSNLKGYNIREVPFKYLKPGEKILCFIKDVNEDKKILEEKLQELEGLSEFKWIESEREFHDIGLLEAFFRWFESNHSTWLNYHNVHFTGLEHGFLIQENDKYYLIVPKHLELEFTNNYQIGILNLLEKKYTVEEHREKMFDRFAKIFRLVIDSKRIKEGNSAEILDLNYIH